LTIRQCFTANCVPAAGNWLQKCRLILLGFHNLIPRPLVEDGAHSLVVESQSESVLFGKFRHVCFSMFCMQRPQTLQFFLVHSAVLPCPVLQFSFNSLCEHFHLILKYWFSTKNALRHLVFTVQKLHIYIAGKIPWVDMTYSKRDFIGHGFCPKERLLFCSVSRWVLSCQEGICLS
jgi:hypothetical protein